MTKAKMNKESVQVASADTHGGVYLIVADDSPEFEAALKRVAYLARQNHGHVAVLYVIEEEGFLHWNFIEKQIQQDQRAEAEKALWDTAQRLYEMGAGVCGFYIKEGKTFNEIGRIVNTDPTIRALVLGASSASSNPLISYFTGKGLSTLRVPLVIVPESLHS